MSNTTETTRQQLTGVLGEWERNGYNDSDFYAVRWNSETGKIENVEVGSTRYGGGPCRFELIHATDEELLAAREASVETIFASLKHAADRRINKPSKTHRGDKLRLLEDVQFLDKKRGTGLVRAYKGEVGTVIWEGHFGTFYANGYNKPGRHNLRVGLKFDDGRVVFCSMEKCGLDEEMPTDAELREKAERLSWNGSFADHSCAWMSWNLAASRLPELKKVHDVQD